MALWTSESCCCCAEQEYLDSASDQVLGLGQDWRKKIQITIAKPRRGEVCFCYVKDGTEVRHPGQTWGCHPWVRESSCLWISALPPHVLYTLPELQPSCLYFRQEKRKSKGEKKKKKLTSWDCSKTPHPVTSTYFPLDRAITRPLQTARKARKCSFVADNIAVLNKIEVFLLWKEEG